LPCFRVDGTGALGRQALSSIFTTREDRSITKEAFLKAHINEQSRQVCIAWQQVSKPLLDASNACRSHAGSVRTSSASTSLSTCSRIFLLSSLDSSCRPWSRRCRPWSSAVDGVDRSTSHEWSRGCPPRASIDPSLGGDLVDPARCSASARGPLRVPIVRRGGGGASQGEARRSDRRVAGRRGQSLASPRLERCTGPTHPETDPPHRGRARGRIHW